MQRAKHYLQNEDLSVSEIAYKTGFSTPSHFSTAFKNYKRNTNSSTKKDLSSNFIFLYFL